MFCELLLNQDPGTGRLQPVIRIGGSLNAFSTGCIAGIWWPDDLQDFQAQEGTAFTQLKIFPRTDSISYRCFTVMFANRYCISLSLQNFSWHQKAYNSVLRMAVFRQKPHFTGMSCDYDLILLSSMTTRFYEVWLTEVKDNLSIDLKNGKQNYLKTPQSTFENY